jgi:hypothetical protein
MKWVAKIVVMLLFVSITLVGCTQKQETGNQTLQPANNTTAPPANHTASANTTKLIVKVYDSQNNSISGARIDLYNLSAQGLLKPKTYYTDDKGIATVEIISPKDINSLTISKDNYKSQGRTLSADDIKTGVVEINLKLDRLGIIVYDYDSKAVVGATVKAYYGHELKGVGYTDENGSTTFNMTTESITMVEVSKDGYETMNETNFGFDLTDTFYISLTMTLVANGTLDGVHHLCGQIHIANDSYRIKTVFKSINDTGAYVEGKLIGDNFKGFGNFTRTPMYGIDCPKAYAVLNQSECSTSGCNPGGIYCNGLAGGYTEAGELNTSVNVPSIAIDKPPGNYTLCIWTSSPEGYLWEGYLYQGYEPQNS